jgi:chemotaxis protein histidine kinase CheA/CheY-like chemotaxis protein
MAALYQPSLAMGAEQFIYSCRTFVDNGLALLGFPFANAFFYLYRPRIMTARESSPNQRSASVPNALDAAELQLQQELRELFAVDTQQHLETYFSLVQRLSEVSWQSDIQNIYRAIHTIKGGAVTVGADGMLHAAMVLEDLLSDLRYLEQAPTLQDGSLSQILSEAGDLLSSTLTIQDSGDAAIAAVQPTVKRIQALHQQVKDRFLQDWNELRQVHQEFAVQGLDLLGLDLEMALANLGQGSLPEAFVTLGHEFLGQLDQIGQDLQLEQDWWRVLQKGSELFATHTDVEAFQTLWPRYCQLLKDCAKQGGKCDHAAPLALDKPAVESTPSVSEPADVLLATVPLEPEPEVDIIPNTWDVAAESAAVDEEPELELELNLSLDAIDLDDLPLADLIEPEQPEALNPLDAAGEGLIANQPAVEHLVEDDFNLMDLSDIGYTEDALSDLAAAIDEFSDLIPEQVIEDEVVSFWPVPEASVIAAPVAPEAVSLEVDRTATTRSLQIPVPLQRLDALAQGVTETLLSTRAVTNTSQTLHSYLTRLTALTQESNQFITHLRQLQDDYAFMRSLREEQTTDGLSLERYRRGYTTINRLLENILRMSEVGQEIETVTQETLHRLDSLNRNVGGLKDTVETSRLVPFRQFALRARATIRDLANRYAKPAILEVVGEQVELDAAVMAQLEPALLHLLRNAYDHGLESVDKRLAAGKSAEGTLTLSLVRLGSRYRLTLKDDGGGIDTQAVRQRSREKGFALTATDTPEALLAVLCQPGFSSRQAANELSGRGVGMDVVATQIAALGGKLSLETRLGQGTSFTVEFPAPQLLVPCVVLQVGDRQIALPADDVYETALLSSLSAESLGTAKAHCNWALETQQGSAAGFDLARYWQPWSSQTEGVRRLPDTAIAVRTRELKGEYPTATEDGPQDIWLIADDLVGQQELLISPLPHPLVSPAGLMGISLQPDGRLLSVLDPVALIEAIQTDPTTAQEPTGSLSEFQAQGPQVTTILIVDDAALMRRRLEASLVTYGYTAPACADGLEAWNWLQSNPLPDLVITDVEMPNMDGFTLIDRCRQAGITIPILVVSSRLSEDWGQEARRLGANAYLNKGFSTSELMDKVQKLLTGA